MMVSLLKVGGIMFLSSLIGLAIIAILNELLEDYNGRLVFLVGIMFLLAFFVSVVLLLSGAIL